LIFCESCPISLYAAEKHIEGCHQCNDFPFPVGRKVILRAISTWRTLGTDRWMEEEEKRYYCPHCGYKLFRGGW
jgi:hypothetical protein